MMLLLPLIIVTVLRTYNPPAHARDLDPGIASDSAKEAQRCLGQRNSDSHSGLVHLPASDRR
eukprot:195882-Pyramimonas_sp.AAC.1